MRIFHLVFFISNRHNRIRFILKNRFLIGKPLIEFQYFPSLVVNWNTRFGILIEYLRVMKLLHRKSFCSRKNATWKLNLCTSQCRQLFPGNQFNIVEYSSVHFRFTRISSIITRLYSILLGYRRNINVIENIIDWYW